MRHYDPTKDNGDNEVPTTLIDDTVEEVIMEDSASSIDISPAEIHEL